MNLSDILQTAVVAAILVGCVIYIVCRNRRRRSACDDCDTPCPLKDSKQCEK